MNYERFSEIWGDRYVEQYRKELFDIVKEVEKLNPRTIIEVGVKKGGTLKFWEQIVPPGDVVIGIDNHPDTRDEIEWDWRKGDRQVIIVIGDSAAPSTIERTKNALKGRLVDFLFIDGFHYEGYPKKDFDNYAPFLRRGGLVVLADLGGWTPDGVWFGGEPCVRDAYLTLPPGRKENRTFHNGMGFWWKP